MKYARGFFCWLLAVFLFCGDAAVCHAEDLRLYAQGAVLMDADSGRVLYEKKGYEKFAMASTTKIMTCILILENCDLNEEAEVSAYAASMPNVRLNVRRGERYRIRSLLFSMMLESHNDSAVVLAEYLGEQSLPKAPGDKAVRDHTADESRAAVHAFAEKMNEKAVEIGCLDTWFVTPNGLDGVEEVRLPSGEISEREHSTTAADLARIMAYCVMRSPKRDLFREITATQSYSFADNGRNVTCNNHNAFLTQMSGAFSGKTGFTNKAGYCYVGALERDGRTYVVALLGCGWPNHKTYKWEDTRTLMQYGIDHFQKRNILDERYLAGESGLPRLKVQNGQEKTLGETPSVPLLIEGRGKAREKGVNVLMEEAEEVEVRQTFRKELDAPVLSGTEVGEITYAVGGEVFFAERIVVGESVERKDRAWYLLQILQRFLVL